MLRSMGLMTFRKRAISCTALAMRTAWKTDNLKNKLSNAHYERIQNNTCKMENSPFYTTLVSELERVADHLVNIGYSIVNPTGDDLLEKADKKA